MSRAARLSNYEIRAEGWRALTERLGVSGAIRFLMEYDPGRGDYVEERREFLKLLGKAKRNIRIEGSFYVCKQQIQANASGQDDYGLAAIRFPRRRRTPKVMASRPAANRLRVEGSGTPSGPPVTLSRPVVLSAS